MIDIRLCGAVYDPAVTEAVCLALASAGKEPLFGDAQPNLAGFGAGKSYLHQDAEVRHFGKTLPSWMQKRGSCTEQGTGRALQHATFSAIGTTQLGLPVEWSSEMLYGVARVQLGKGQFGQADPWGSSRGNGDGCSGALVAQAAHDYGWLPRGVHGSFDLSKPREDLAIAWGNTGTPDELLSQSKQYRARACMQAKTVENVRDALAARFGAAGCGTYATEGMRDKNGYLVPQNISPGGHCEEISGVFIDMHGDLMFVIQQSWGDRGPQGGGNWELQDGREVVPADGAAAVHVEAIENYLKYGEIWLLAPPENLPQSEAA